MLLWAVQAEIHLSAPVEINHAITIKHELWISGSGTALHYGGELLVSCLPAIAVVGGLLPLAEDVVSLKIFC